MDKVKLDSILAIRRTGGNPRLKCPTCGNRFELPAKGRVPEYCSATCRIAAHRTKKRNEAYEKSKDQK